MSNKPQLNDNTVYLVDGSGYVFRAFFAIPQLHSRKNVPTNAVFGFTNMLLKLLFEHKPKYLAIAFDKKEPTFRHKIYPDYKANRPKPPEELVPQFALIHQVVEALGIKSLSISGFEADDIIGTLAKMAKKANHEVILVSGDKDFMQLVDDDVWLLDELRAQKTGTEVFFGKKEVVDELGVNPEQVVDMLALMGDSSDNVPGIAGVGPKTAISLLNEFGSLDKILSCAPLIKQKSLKEKIIAQSDLAKLSKQLVIINTDVPIELNIKDLQYNGIDKEKTRELFVELDFNKLLKDGRLPLNNEPSYNKTNEFFKGEPQYKLEVKDLAECQKISLFHSDKNLGIATDDGVLTILPINNETKSLILKAKKNIISHDAKNIYKIFSTLEIKINGDTMLESYLLHQDTEAHDLLSLCKKNLDIDPDVKNLNEAFLAYLILKLHEQQYDELKKENLDKLYHDLELPLEPVLASMEMRGIKIDAKVLDALGQELSLELRNLESKAYEMAGEKFNLLSPKQVGQILFEKLKLKTMRKTKTGFSTDQHVLEKLKNEHPLIEVLLKVRMYSKLMNTYVESLPSIMDKESGRIHTSFNQFVTATGRLSSKDPNLQNIPIRTKEGRRIREAFVAEEGFSLISLDYSQVELRLLAFISKDPVLEDAFKNDQDVHVRTASEIFEIDQSKITKEQRNIAKTINFGLIYGMGAQKLAATLNISFKEAKTYLEKYFQKYQGVVSWKKAALEKAKEKQEVRTLFGRKRSVPEILSDNPMEQSRGERLAINTPIQGTAADIMKKSMIEVHKYLQKNYPRAHLLLQVHDELVIEAPTDLALGIAQDVSNIMSTAHGLELHLKVDFGIGANWQQAH